MLLNACTYNYFCYFFNQTATLFKAFRLIYIFLIFVNIYEYNILIYLLLLADLSSSQPNTHLIRQLTPKICDRVSVHLYFHSSIHLPIHAFPISQLIHSLRISRTIHSMYIFIYGAKSHRRQLTYIYKYIYSRRSHHKYRTSQNKSKQHWLCDCISEINRVEAYSLLNCERDLCGSRRVKCRPTEKS